MRSILFRIASVVAVAGWATPGTADAQAPAQQPARQVWEADWVSPHCTITTGQQHQTLALWTVPGDPDPELYIVGPTKIVPDADRKLTVTLLPAGQTFHPSAEAGLGDAGQRVLKLSDLGASFPAAFAASSAISVSGGMTVTLAIAGASKAMAAMRQCVDLQLPKWRIDAKAYDALLRPPTTIDGLRWFTDNDYPRTPGASFKNRTVVARVGVDAGGKVTSCDVVQPSDTWSLDSATCRAALKRLRFHPAIGADGQPIAAQRIIVMLFGLSACGRGHRCS